MLRTVPRYSNHSVSVIYYLKGEDKEEEDQDDTRKRGSNSRDYEHVFTTGCFSQSCLWRIEKQWLLSSLCSRPMMKIRRSNGPLAKTRKAKIFPNKRIMSVVSVFPPHSAACPICLSRATTSSHAGSCLASLPSVHWPLSSQFLCWLQRALALKTREPKIFLGRGSHRLALGEQLRDWSYTRLLKEVKSTSNHSCKLLTHKSNQLAITVV